MKEKDQSDIDLENLRRDYILMRTTLAVMMKKCSELNNKLEEVTEIENINEVLDEFKKRSNRLIEVQKENTILKKKINQYRQFGAVIKEENESKDEKTKSYLNTLIEEVEKTLKIENKKKSMPMNQRILRIKTQIQQLLVENRMKIKKFEANIIQIENETKKIESYIESEKVPPSDKYELQSSISHKNNELTTAILMKEKTHKQIDALKKLDENLPENFNDEIENSIELQNFILENLFLSSGDATVDKFIKILQVKDDEQSFPLMQQISNSLTRIYKALEFIHKINQSSDSNLIPFDISDEQDLKAANVKYAHLLADISILIKSNYLSQIQQSFSDM